MEELELRLQTLPTFTTPINDFDAHFRELLELIELYNTLRTHFFHTTREKYCNRNGQENLFPSSAKKNEWKAERDQLCADLIQQLIHRFLLITRPATKNKKKRTPLKDQQNTAHVLCADLPISHLATTQHPPPQSSPAPPNATDTSHSLLFDSSLSFHQKAAFIYIRGHLDNLQADYNYDAELNLSRAIKLHPRQILAWNSIGECFWKKNDLEMARLCFETANRYERNKVCVISRVC